ncbi:hypothetical protein [Aliiglaciecola lipolytica]|uniref:hypothetical protein n=1 Tax=Aliiglaciecola lipolytica TaxID=477689 RepID=UPI001C0851F5|nr:hypothetical protein [Aliiglaciecola lipolytica]MBU2878576.1 hypothetical protein [Aliiglaciecola lipolytica]
MFKYLCLFMTLVGSSCQAGEFFIAKGVNWLNNLVPETTKIEFNKSRIKFDGCRHREYELTFSQPVNQRLSFEGGMSYANGKLQWGINSQKISLKRYSFLPRYSVNRKISLSAGVILQSAPEFSTSQGLELALPKSKIYKISSRFKGIRDDHQVDIALSSHHWDANDEFGTLFDNGLIDNKLNVNYAAFF